MFPDMEVLNVNGHIHTPYSFSAFSDIDEIVSLALKEDVTCLGINDFFVADGYDAFHEGTFNHGIFPLFNIEFIGLMKDEQKKGIRINDPNNPGRCYFCGKGLDYPFHVDQADRKKLETIIDLSQEQIKAMIAKLNSLFADIGCDIKLNYADIKSQLAKKLVRERHLAKAVRLAVIDKYPDSSSQTEVFSALFNGTSPKSSLTDIPAFENEIRSRLLKSGGRAFVEEDESTFLPIDDIAGIIIRAGGIPCYPLLLDDANGNYTEFESSFPDLLKELSARNIGCIELISGRNDASHLDRLVRFFNDAGFVILMGTEHNTPQIIPLTCDTRGGVPLSPEMKKIAYEGACVIAAHQYYRARGKQGYINESGLPAKHERENFARLGNAIIHYQRQKNKL